MFPALRGLVFTDDGNIIRRISQALRLITAAKPVFKLDVFLQNDPNIYIKNYVQNDCLKIFNDVGKHDPLTDGFVHFHLIKFCVNTHTQYMSANITLPAQEYF